jgi:hypothetical protein
VGLEAACLIRIDGQTARGTARLEHKDLVFRGPIRVSVPLAQITHASARDGTLVVRFAGRQAELEIGEPAASRWGQRITNPPSRLDKLGVKPGMRVALVNLPDSAFRVELERAGATVLARIGSSLDALFFGAAQPDDLDRLASLKDYLQPSGALWVIRKKGEKKGETKVTERASMAAGKKAGLVDVKVVSFSDTYTAEKYVTPLEKRAKPARSSPPSRRTPRSAPSQGRK